MGKQSWGFVFSSASKSMKRCDVEYHRLAPCVQAEGERDRRREARRQETSPNEVGFMLTGVNMRHSIAKTI